MPQDSPGDEYLDLRDIITRYDTEVGADGQEQDTEYIEQAEALFADYYGDYEEAAQNEPSLILEREFTNYAMEFAYDIGAADRDAMWPPIDWDHAAEELKMDFTEVEFGGHTYLTRGY